MAIKKVDLKPIGRAMEKAREDLKELAERASPEGAKEIRKRIGELNLLIRQLPKVCRGGILKSPPVFTSAGPRPYKAFTIAVQPQRCAVPKRKKK
jgi:hypothetical protein